MTAYVEQFRRSEVGVDPIEGRLQIPRLLLPDDQARRKRWRTSVEVRLLRTFHDILPMSSAYSSAVRPPQSCKSSGQLRAAQGTWPQPHLVWIRRAAQIDRGSVDQPGTYSAMLSRDSRLRRSRQAPFQTRVRAREVERWRPVVSFGVRPRKSQSAPPQTRIPSTRCQCVSRRETFALRQDNLAAQPQHCL